MKLKILMKKVVALVIEYIFNDLSDRITLKDKIYIFFFFFLRLIIDIINYILLKFYQDLVDKIIYNQHFYLFELLFLFLISIFIYKNKYYIHQYYSIIITLILGLIRFLFIRSYYSKIIKEGTKFVLIFIFQILVSFFESLLIVYTKGLMEYKYFSPYKACYVFSIINSIIILICYIIISFIPCKNSYCTIKYKDKYYIDNILYIFKNMKIGPFIHLVFGSIITAIFKLLNNVTINKFTVCHLFLLFEAEDISNSIIDQ